MKKRRRRREFPFIPKLWKQRTENKTKKGTQTEQSDSHWNGIFEDKKKLSIGHHLNEYIEMYI